MLIKPISDLHTEFWKLHKRDRLLKIIVPEDENDKHTTLCLAGDIGLAGDPETWLRTVNSLAERFKYVVYVEGNHFFYHNNYYGRIKMIVDECKLAQNVFFLEKNHVVLDGVLFLGCTFWTDLERDPLAMVRAGMKMNDYKFCKHSDGTPLRPVDTAHYHKFCRDYIFNTLKETEYEKVVVITHHAPSYQSISGEYVNDELSAAYATEYGREIEAIGKPNLWIHAHIHSSSNYMIGNTRIVANPFGYHPHDTNKGYKPFLTIEI